MHPPVHQFMAATRAAAKRCKASATLLERRVPEGRLIDVNVVRLSDKRVVFSAEILISDLVIAPQAMTTFVTRQIYDAHERLEAAAVVSAWRFAYR